MEIRNIQKTGGSSFSLTLPKAWIKKHHLNDKDKVIINDQKSGSIVIIPYLKNKTKFSTTIPIDSLSKDQVRREIIAQYLSGADDIKLKAQTFTPELTYVIKTTVLNLIGVEILEQTVNSIIIQDVFDSKKFPIKENAKKMFMMIISMYRDVLQAMENRDKNLALDIISRDVEVNKHYYAILRQFVSILQNKITEEETGVSLVGFHYYQEVAIQLERIADHIVKIARMLFLQSKRSQKAFTRSLQRVTKRVLIYLQEAESCFDNLNKNEAHKIVDFQRSLSKNAPINKNIVKKTSIEIIIEDSLDRIRGYITNIAENVIDYVSIS